MTYMAKFGDPARFEIAIGWSEDREPRNRRPTHGGWSTGELCLTVGNYILTRHEYNGKTNDAVKWYLLPVLEWIAKNWVYLFHEERFEWHENSISPAATAVFFQFRRFIDTCDASGEAAYTKIQNWWGRHALRAADSSALYPDIFIRRLVDEIEISWTGRQPAYAPDGFQLMLVPGAATLSVAAVAGPLWEMLAWAVSCHPVLNAEDGQSISDLEQAINKLSLLPTQSLEEAYLSPKLFKTVTKVRTDVDLKDNSVRLDNVPVITKVDDAVLMFGGVSPNIGIRDATMLMKLMASHRGGSDSAILASLVNTEVAAPLSAPYEQGYELAEELLDELDISSPDNFVDVEAIINKLNIDLIMKPLRTATIRGVAIAGNGYRPMILVNTHSSYNRNEAGIRFTLAHELFHILYDRERAQKITHTSGPWAVPSIEKRANAFAAMLLMPRSLVRRLVRHNVVNFKTLSNASNIMKVGISALLEHLYNIGMIDEAYREELRYDMLAKSLPRLA